MPRPEESRAVTIRSKSHGLRIRRFEARREPSGYRTNATESSKARLEVSFTRSFFGIRVKLMLGGLTALTGLAYAAHAGWLGPMPGRAVGNVFLYGCGALLAARFVSPRPLELVVDRESLLIRDPKSRGDVERRLSRSEVQRLKVTVGPLEDARSRQFALLEVVLADGKRAPVSKFRSVVAADEIAEAVNSYLDEDEGSAVVQGHPEG